jgi:hypothetical protein
MLKRACRAERSTATRLQPGSPEPLAQPGTIGGGRGRGPLDRYHCGAFAQLQADRRINAGESCTGTKPPIGSEAATRKGRQDNSDGSMPRSRLQRHAGWR